MPARSRMQPWMFVSAAWIVPAVFGAVNELAQKRLFGGRVSVPEVLFASLDWLLYAFLTPGVFAVSRRWPLARPHLARRAALHFGMSLVFCAAWAGLGTVLRALLMPQNLWGGPAAHFVSWLFITFPFGVSVYLCVVGIEHATRYFVDARDRDIQLARLSEQLSSARFAALQAQVNPHFLFNTLNTIAVHVRDDDRRGAVRIVEQLSDVLRRTLRRHRTNEVTLGEELELVRQYLAIEQARFSDRLRPTFDVDNALLGAAVPSFALQHLVENAIRHGIARRGEAGRVHIAARRVGATLDISVRDDGPGIDAAAGQPEGHGLANTRERLRALYGDRGSLEVGLAEAVGPAEAGRHVRPRSGTLATLRVPYRELGPEPDRADR